MTKAREWAAQDRAMARALQEVERLVMAKRLKEVEGMSQQDYWTWKRAQERAPRPGARSGMADLERAVTAAQNEGERAPEMPTLPGGLVQRRYWTAKEGEGDMETTGTVPETPAPVGRTQELVLPVMDGVVQISAPRPLRAIDAERVAAGLRLLITDEQEEGAK